MQDRLSFCFELDYKHLRKHKFITNAMEGKHRQRKRLPRHIHQDSKTTGL